MQITMKNFGAVTDDKAEWVETQANRTLDFLMTSRQLLTKEAHTTLNWLFAIMLAAASYSIRILELSSPAKTPWPLVWLLIIVSVTSMSIAIYLFQSALRAVPVLPTGNDPRNLLNDELMGDDISRIRLAEVASVQVRIDAARLYNNHVADAIAVSRWVIVLLPAICLVACVLIQRFFST